MIVYKTLDADGRSQIRNYQWPLPREDGSPGDWLTVTGDIVLCKNGLHGWLTEDIAKSQTGRYAVYEMEIEEDIVQDESKAAGRRGRLLRMLYDENGEVPIKLGELVWQ